MADTDKKKAFEGLWQHLNLQHQAAALPEAKKESLNQLITHLEVAHSSQIISLDTFSLISNKLSEELSSCETSASKSSASVESAPLRSSLSMESVAHLPCIAEYKAASKKALLSLIPATKENSALPIKTKWKPAATNNASKETKRTESPRKKVPSQKRSLFDLDESEFSITNIEKLQAPKTSKPLFIREDSACNYSATSFRNNEILTKEVDYCNEKPAAKGFRSAKEQLEIENQKKFGNGKNSSESLSVCGNSSNNSVASTSRKQGIRQQGLSRKFVSPLVSKDEPDEKSFDNQKIKMDDERLKSMDPKMIELITSEIMDQGPPIAWDDIAGLEFAKKTIREIVIWPMLRPDIFTGLRGPPKGLLLFGPPGTGKTLIGKCIACQSKSTFFSISASSLTSKWVGEGEKMVKALFMVARAHQPAVVFIDEIDSLLSQRSNEEHESSRRIKTEFLVQLDGATTGQDERILVVGATNRPQEIDEAARRRFVKRLYIPLPEEIAREQIIQRLISQQTHSLTEKNLKEISEKSDGYSGSDMANLCREAALGPIRTLAFDDIENLSADQVRPIELKDFEDALRQVRASVSQDDLDQYLEWNKQYGSFGI